MLTQVGLLHESKKGHCRALTKLDSGILTSFALADHYAGLSETWGHGVIYCSEQTARLIQHMDQLRIRKDLIRPLPMDTPVAIDGDSPLKCLY